MELNDLVDNPAWMKVWMDYCNGNNGRLSGYLYMKTGDVAQATKAIGGIRGGIRTPYATEQHYAGADVLKPIDVPRGLNGLVTNDANQPSLQIIEVLELCKDQLPTEAAPTAGGGGAAKQAARPWRARGGAARGAPPATGVPAQGE